jgi:hypothetical protein
MALRDRVGPIVDEPRRKFRVTSKSVPYQVTELVKLVGWDESQRVYSPVDGVLTLRIGEILNCYDVTTPQKGLIHLVCDQFGEQMAVLNPDVLLRFMDEADAEYTFWFDEV